MTLPGTSDPKKNDTSNTQRFSWCELNWKEKEKKRERGWWEREIPIT